MRTSRTRSALCLALLLGLVTLRGAAASRQLRASSSGGAGAGDAGSSKGSSRSSSGDPGGTRLAPGGAGRAVNGSTHADDAGGGVLSSSSGDGGGGGGRGLQQLTTKAPDKEVCLAAYPHCVGCSYRQKGNTTKLYCTLCDINYKLIWQNNTCRYQPSCGGGTHFDPDANGCLPCGYNFYCPAAVGNVSSRIPCASNLGTRGLYSRGPWECMALWGYGWVRGGNVEGAVVPCPVGTYNPQRFTAGPTWTVQPDSLPWGCRPCPGNLTTLHTGAKSTMECVAPPGHYYDLGKAVPCPPGSYKPAAGNDDCTGCQDGLTTSVPGAVLVAECNVVMPGYQARRDGLVGPCPVDSYNPGGQTWQGPGTADVNCTKCPAGMAAETDGAMVREDCVAPPGWGYNASAGVATICPIGTYNPGWNSEPCRPCGKNILTDFEGSAMPDDCYIPPGYGSSQWNGVWTAFPCPADSFGVDQPSPGLVRIECLGCMEHMTTFNETGALDDSFCLTKPGWGYYNEMVRPCLIGEWSAGMGRQPCTPCPIFYSTADAASTSASDCQIQTGYTSDGRSGVVACPLGTYKDEVGPQACTKCPNGTTTATPASESLYDCGLCRAGFGANSINPTDPFCTLCLPGTYSMGGGMRCLPCHTSGLMTSPMGAQNYDMCVYEFLLPGSTTGSHFDFVQMAPEALNVSGTAFTLDACQAECDAASSTADGCQYFEYRAYEAEGSRCWLRRLELAVPSNSTASDDTPKIFFHVKSNVYAVYKAHETDWASLGAPLTSGNPYHTTWAAAITECERSPSCAGIKYSPTGGPSPWRLFAGSLSATTTSRVHAWGLALNPWVAPPKP